MCRELLDDQETEENAVDVEEVCHRRRWKRELGVDEVEVLVTVEKDGGSVNQLVQCGSSKGCGGLPECRWLAAGDGEVV